MRFKGKFFSKSCPNLCVNNSEASLLNKSSCLDATLGVTKFIAVNGISLVTLFVLLKSDLDVQQTHLWFQAPR